MENAAVGGLICSASQHITSQDWLSLTQGNILSSTDLILKSFSAFTQIKMMATLAKAKATARERERERETGTEIVTVAAPETAEEAVEAVERLFDAMSTSVALGRSWG